MAPVVMDGTGGDGDGTGGDGDGTGGDGDGTGGDGDGTGGDGDGTGGDGDGSGGDGDGTGGDGDGTGGDGDGTGGDGDGTGGDGDGSGGDGDGDGDGDGTGGDGDGTGGDGDGTGGDGDGDGDHGGGSGDGGHILIANAGGTYEVDLGDLFVLDGCASSFDSAYLCGLDLSQFSVAWLLNGQVIGTDIRLTDISTGPGTLFPTSGNYDVTLSVVWLGGPSVADSDVAAVRVGNAVAIPEPASLLIFGTGAMAIVFIGWRRRRYRIRGPDRKSSR